jgi:hypothetical protein
MTHPAALDPDRLLADCDIRFTRRSGPGGQNRNKVETAVILTHRPTGITAEASERRSQVENRNAALRRLRLALAREIRGGITPEDGPSALWRGRLRDRRIAINPAHDDYPALLAEALDAIEAHAGDVRAAAGWLGCSPSQLIRLLSEDPRAFADLNASRRERGLRPLGG